MINDPIADLLTRVRNANMRKHKTVSMPHSKVKEQIVAILLREGFVLDYKVQEEKGTVKKNLVITLKYKGTQRVITGLKRVSKPGLRQYQEASKLPQVLNGLGIAIISTSKGIMTDSEARAAGIGGEVMLYA